MQGAKSRRYVVKLVKPRKVLLCLEFHGLLGIIRVYTGRKDIPRPILIALETPESANLPVCVKIE